MKLCDTRMDGGLPIVAIYNESGTKVASYTYSNAWGKHSVSFINGGGSTGAQYNPFRYRGYYYDTDLEMYYLRSRYYDPNTCRFINADGYVSTGQGILGNNMFAYCCNNPVMLIDAYGDAAFPYYLHWRGDIHKEIQDHLAKLGYLIEVPVLGGRIDLVIDGYAYELKPETCPKRRAINQLERYIKASGNKYIVGIDRPELNGSFYSKYGVSVDFYYADDGIIYYRFYENGNPLEHIITVPKQEKNILV